MIGEDFCYEALYVKVFADTNYGNNTFDFDSDFSGGVDGCFHTSVYKRFYERANRLCENLYSYQLCVKSSRNPRNGKLIAESVRKTQFVSTLSFGG